MATYDSESDVVSDNEDIEVAMSDTEVESPKPKQKRRSRLFPLDRILAVLCCPSLCLAGFTEADLAPLRENYQSLDRTGKKQWLLDYFWSHSQFDNENYTWRFTFVLWSKEVCQTAFRLTLGIASSSFYEVRKLFLDKKKVISQPRTKRTQAFKSKQAMAWLQSYAEKYGKRPNPSQIRLPQHCTKQQVYDTLVEETRCAISQSHFLRLWREEASQIIISDSKNG